MTKGDVCRVDGCEGAVRSLDLCYKHYMRQYRKGTTEGADQTTYDTEMCAVGTCTRRRVKSAYCRAHYTRLYRHGDVQEHIPLREVGTVTWSLNKKGYVRRHQRINGKSVTILKHREVMEQHLGRKLLRSEEVHHVNGDKQNNRIRNLELWSTSQPAGQRVEDKVAWAIEILDLYGRDFTQPGKKKS